jgi:hexosaminidase
MTDGQSWPLDIPAFPDLSQKGAYRRGLSYSPSDIDEIQSYGLYRGVEVYIEIDMPGHTSAIALAYPDLVAAVRILGARAVQCPSMGNLLRRASLWNLKT